ncbi:fumarylacetoacetate hydrolase family protein [Flexivirga caeni]|uniref:FAA hydrolase family protein n=1 Tax=Flexivirga caeni TaxID=2294115 RepID=A0A3M9MBG1_9MICO|nr:fumarylacetoacetate hydrolase family protein [Flexivirga caeni]RNI22920.1 FAA hydrolase family protein [Flexivirga caeni]
MRLATMVEADRSIRAAADTGDGWRALPATDLSGWFASGARLEPGELLNDAEPTLPLPRPHKVICCGLNYGDHILEMGRELPSYPTLFAKFADTLTGPIDDIVLPRGLQVDWEAELAVVVGAELRRATADEARAGIAGYTVANDISVRDWQNRTLQWLQGKAWDASTPVGPVVVSPDAVDPAAGVDVVCRINGVERQRGDTSRLVFDSAALLAYVSAFTVLRPGDLVLTGTPGGVGQGLRPPTFLTDGDVLETEITGIGRLRNVIRLTD